MRLPTVLVVEPSPAAPAGPARRLAGRRRPAARRAPAARRRRAARARAATRRAARARRRRCARTTTRSRRGCRRPGPAAEGGPGRAADARGLPRRAAARHRARRPGRAAPAGPEIGPGLVAKRDAADEDRSSGGCPSPRTCCSGTTTRSPSCRPARSLLAASTRYPHQAFRVGDRAWGLQFHIECTPAMVADWAGRRRAPAAPSLGFDRRRRWWSSWDRTRCTTI